MDGCGRDQFVRLSAGGKVRLSNMGRSFAARTIEGAVRYSLHVLEHLRGPFQKGSIEKRHFRVSNGSLDGRSREYQEPITCVVQEVSTQGERFLGDKLGGVPS